MKMCPVTVVWGGGEEDIFECKTQTEHDTLLAHPAVCVGLYELLEDAGEDRNERPPLRHLLGRALHGLQGLVQTPQRLEGASPPPPPRPNAAQNTTQISRANQASGAIALAKGTAG